MASRDTTDIRGTAGSPRFGLGWLSSAIIIAALFLLPASASASPIFWNSFGSFAHPSGIAVEEATGNVFVADGGFSNTVKIFGSEGEAPIGVAAAEIYGFWFENEPSGLAFDNSGSASAGTLYVADVRNSLLRKYRLNPATEAYEEVGQLTASPGFNEPLGVTVDAEGNVYVADYGSSSVVIFDPAGTETGRIDVSASVNRPSSVAVDPAGDVFVQAFGTGSVYKFPAGSSGQVEPGTTPIEVVPSSSSGIAVDPATGVLYLAMGSVVAEYDSLTLQQLGEFGSGASLETTERIAVDSSRERIYVTDKGKNRVAVFIPPPPPVAPVVIGVSAVPTYTEAELRGNVDPGNDVLTYYFEYGPTQSYGGRTETKTLPLGFSPTDIAAFAFGLAPGSSYHFRIIVSNSVGTVVGSDQTFSTKSRPPAALPDNRAYELVTPPNMNGARPAMLDRADGGFETLPVSADGRSLLFGSMGGIPGSQGTGSREMYESVRSSAGWVTQQWSPSGAQAVQTGWAGVSPDHQYSILGVSNGGTLDISGSGDSIYVRRPDGVFELLGAGSLGADPTVDPYWASSGAHHVLFSSRVPLAPGAPPAGVKAIYDRPLLGPARVISLLPNDVTPSSAATFLGTDEIGASVVFEVEGTMYVRRNNTETFEIAGGYPTYAGISTSGSRVVYVKGGDIFAFDVGSGTSLPIGSGGESTVVNVSADGSYVYFSSPKQLDGAAGAPGEHNLYFWDGSGVEFIAVLDPQDFASFDGQPLVSLAQWTRAVGPRQDAINGRADDPSRTTPDGSTFVFQSHGVKGYPYDSSGHSQVYRYDTRTDELMCLSCNGFEPASSDAVLQPMFLTYLGSPSMASSRVYNVTDDGQAVFFQSSEALVPEDTDGKLDVYEWKQGNGVALISSGRSSQDDYLYGMTPDGHDVFFRTGDALVPGDENGGTGGSIYDARVDGGFASAPPPPAPCQESSCQSPGASAPAGPGAGSALVHGAGNRKHRRHRVKHRRHRHKRSHRHGEHQAPAGHNRGGSK